MALSLPIGIKPLRAAVFDLDGVITKTRDTHYQSWKKLFDCFLPLVDENPKPFTMEDYDKYVDGRPRYSGVETFLKSRNISLPQGEPSDEPWDTTSSQTTVCSLGNKKDHYFNEVLDEKGVGVYESTLKVIKFLVGRGIPVGVASSSKNCKLVLKKAGLENLFEAVVDGIDREKQGFPGKPDPAMFLECLSRLGKFDPKESLLVEDAQSGVEAGSNGHFGLVLGVNRGNNTEALKKAGAHIVVDDFDEILQDSQVLESWFAQGKQSSQSAAQ